MENGVKATRRRTAMRKLAKILAAGFACSARATAMREAMPWNGEERLAAGRTGRRHNTR
ncbi:MAG: hypothetical protein ACREU4_13185 [Burkholderiales bacterium]